MGRIGRGFKLLGASWEVLKADRELLLLPLVSMLASLAVLATFLGGLFAAGVRDRQNMGPVHYVLVFIMYVALYFIAIFFNAAIVAAATIRLEGGNPTLKDGLSKAAANIGKIFGWALVAASVGLVLRTIQERSGILGRIVVALVGAAWSAITFFVVPILIFEPLGVGGSIKKSAAIFKERWGEQFVGNGSLGIALFLLMIPVVLVSLLLAAVTPWLGIAFGAIGFMLLITAGGAMSGIFNAALYRYATTGEALGGFSDEDLSSAFRPKKRRGAR
ncbi:MAG: DUF6159 family protein [Actinomycetota bacterium]|nr:DUF6159 family protein [Actinomycetota bacterium]